MESTNGEVLRELHRDLARKYRIHSQAIERIWRSLDGPQRAKCLKAGMADGVVLKHPHDSSLGDVYKFVPELNLQDIAKPGSDFALHHLKFRATVPLSQQYCSGVDGELGDHGFILKMMTEKGLRAAQDYKDCYSRFYDDSTYGNAIHLVSHRAETLSKLGPAIRAQLIVPQSMGELILARQINLLQVFNILIEDILEAGSNRQRQGPAPPKNSKPASQALPRLSSTQEQPKLTISDISANAYEQQLCLEDHLELMSTVPLVLAHVVNVRFFSQPELVADEKGRRGPVHTDKFISRVLFETMQDAVKGVSIWSYISLLLRHLQYPGFDKAYRTIIQQELVNACHIEYTRTQSNFKRLVQMGSGAKWFKRISSAQGQLGTARVKLKGNIETLFGTDVQLYYVLQLCQPDIGPSKAIEWIGKLSDLHRNHPTEREKLLETEIDGLGDLAVILEFIQDITSTMSLPSFSRKTGQTLTQKWQELDVSVAGLKTGVDLRDFAVPIDHLLEDGMAAGALTAVDEHLSKMLGKTMSVAYHDLVSDCAAELAERYQQVKAQIDGNTAKALPPFSIPTEPTSALAPPRREKEKTRGVASAGVSEETEAATETPVHETPEPPTLRVKPATAQVFKAIFRKSEARGVVSWDAFEAAMANLGFSVVPKFGSVITFLPSSAMSVKRSITLHRPHGSQIEGYRLLIIAKRLARVYGWGDGTFQEA